MTLERVTCWTITCDACGDGWLGEAPHFRRRDFAVDLARKDGWAVDGEIRCPSCLIARACSMAGHRWGAWAPAGPFPRADGTTWQGDVRHCRVCSSAEWDPTPRSTGTVKT